MTRHNHSAAWRLDGAMWQIIVLGILLVGTWPLSACSGGSHRPMGGTVPGQPGGTMPGQSGPTGMPQPMSHPRPNHP
jgi:hypothetical protein